MTNRWFDFSGELTMFHSFERDMDILEALLDKTVLDQYGTKKTPLAFQGNGSFAVILDPKTQSVKAYNLVAKDGNGGWKQIRTNWFSPHEQGSRWYLKRKYCSLAEKCFRRKIVFEVAADGRKELTGAFVLVAYQWTGGQTPKQVPLRKQYQARSIGTLIKQEICSNLSGKPISPTVEYHKDSPSISTPEDLKVNPYYVKTGGKRYFTYAKSRALVKKYGEKDYASLNDHLDLIARRFEVDGVEKMNYIVGCSYAVALLQHNGRLHCSNKCVGTVFYVKPTHVIHRNNVPSGPFQ